jgi:putative membrane protein
MGKQFLIVLTKFAINALALLLADQILSGVHFDSNHATLAAAVVLALVNSFLRPLIILLTLPINILTLGLLTLVINALLLRLVASIIPGFHIDGFWVSVLAALIISLVSILLNMLLNPPAAKIIVHRHRHDS